MKKLAGMNPDGSELRERFHLMLNQRIETDLEFRDLFRDAYKAMKKGDQAKMKRLFVQHAAVVTQAPNLTAEIPDPPMEAPDPYKPGQPASTGVGDGAKLTNQACSPSKPKKLSLKKTASVAPSVDQWFEKNAQALLTEAQQRFPELLKVAQPVPVDKTIKPKTNGKTPAQASLSGGAA
jgi:hypothetical protein